jgi:hypothetical protein
MTNDKFQMTKECRIPNDEGKAFCRVGTGSKFGLCHSFIIRYSDFVIVQSLLRSAVTIL